MKLLKATIAVIGITLCLGGCNKTQSNNAAEENVSAPEMNTPENTAAIPANNASADEIAPANATGNGTKEDTNIRH